jgi:hypothetical protein
MRFITKLCATRRQAWRLIGVLCMVAFASSRAQSHYLELSLADHTLAVYGGQNACYLFETSSDLTNWTPLTVASPTVDSVLASLVLTQNTVFLRTAVLGSWSVGMFNKVLNLKSDFGAVGDGTNDDTGAIQAALNSALLYSNAVVFVAPGTYRLTQTCSMPSGGTNGIQSRPVLVGVDPSRTIFLWGGTGGGPMFQFLGCSPQFGGITFQSADPQVASVIYSAPP